MTGKKVLPYALAGAGVYLLALLALMGAVVWADLTAPTGMPSQLR